MMRKLDNIAEELFNQLRGRCPSIEMGDAEGNITDEPKAARFFEFDYQVNGEKLGKMNATLDASDGLVIMFNKDFTENTGIMQKQSWFNFLKGMRTFAKKRLLNFEIRDISRSNLTKRDYNFLTTNRSGEQTMAESKMYGTNKTSYQKIGNARLAIKHAAPINTESAKERTKHIGAIYIESADGERFKYPFKHLSGARAMARHVSEGGNAYDEFGQYISGMSGELSKLRKFKQYMNRSSVMAESLSGYMDVVNERISNIKKTIQGLQKESHYRTAFEEYVPIETNEVPDEIAENWIDQLTIKQFNEELKDVFPYIYNLVSEATRAEDLTFEGLMYEEGVTQGEVYHVVQRGDTVYNLARKFNISSDDIVEVNGLDDNATIRVGEKLVIPGITQADYNRATGASIGAGAHSSTMPNGTVDGSTRGINPVDNHGPKGVQRLTQSIEYAIDKLMGQFSESSEDEEVEECPCEDDMEQEQPKISIPEFILSYFDRETGQFPKGETAVLTAVGKEYGEHMIQPANMFIERLNAKVAEVMGYKEAPLEEEKFDTSDLKPGDIILVAPPHRSKQGPSERKVRRVGYDKVEVISITFKGEEVIDEIPADRILKKVSDSQKESEDLRRLAGLK